MEDSTLPPKIDLSACEREDLGRIGLVQPFGTLAAFDPCGDLVAIAGPPSDLREVATSIGHEAIPSSPTRLEREGLADRELFAHRSGDILIVEEIFPTEPPSPDLDAKLREARDRLAACGGANPVRCAQILAECVSTIARYDRVMVYRFHQDWSGEVIADFRKPDATSFLGLRYPASDIPPQARSLYLRNRLRVVGDVKGIDHFLRPMPGRSPPDLSMAILRAVSRFHVEYLENMGVRATLTASIIRNGALWGMIACHHDTPRFPPAELRDACLALAADFVRLLDAAELAAREAAEATLRSLSTMTARSRGKLDWLLFSPEGRAAWRKADGIAIARRGRIIGVGCLPPPRTLREFIEETGEERLIVRDRLGLPPIAPWLPSPCGMCAWRGKDEVWVGLFRRELIREVIWGGNPNKPVQQSGDGRLSPRRSFAAWREIMRGASRPWDDDDAALVKAIARCLALEPADWPRFASSDRVEDFLSEKALISSRLPALLLDGMDVETKRVSHVTPAFATFTGLPPSELLGRSWRSLSGALPVFADAPGEGGERDPTWTLFSPERGVLFVQHRAETALLLLGEEEHWIDIVHLEDATLETGLSRSLQGVAHLEESLSEARKALLRNVSHEFRTPLNAIIGFAQLLMEPTSLTDEERRNFAKEIHAAGQDLLRIVDLSIETARRDSGKVSVQLSEVDLNTVARDIFNRLQKVFEAKRIRLEMAVSDPIMVKTEPALLRQALTAVLENALKFSPPDGVVRMNVSATWDLGWIEITDEGPGVPEVLQDRIFEPFARGDESLSSATGGLGLGLFLASSTIKLLGGVIRHRNLSRGSLFRLGVPRT